jgi:hypothetical protein
MLFGFTLLVIFLVSVVVFSLGAVLRCLFDNSDEG